MPTAIDKTDVQGLVRTGFPDMVHACYYLLRVKEPAAARDWLRTATTLVNDSVSPKEAPVADEAKTTRALQIAFTWEGLKQLGVPEYTKDGFSLEFASGIAGESNRRRRLGDIGKNDPAHWEWGVAGNAPHVLVIICAVGDLDQWVNAVKGPSWTAAFTEIAPLDTSHIKDDKEPFGFADGLSQPVLDWDLKRKTPRADLEFDNLVAAGEFLLGYPNEYGKYTERPFVEAKDDPHGILPPVERDPARRDLGLNGTYLVFRDLVQDVSGFWQFLDKQAGGDAVARERLGAVVVGRTIDGTPLMPVTSKPIPGIEKNAASNNFTYDDDPSGLLCPIGAHIRRANPRSADMPPGTKGLWKRLQRLVGFGGIRPDDDVVSSTRFHRILRRGREYEYGPPLAPADAAKPGAGEGAKRGLRFVCLNANITRQFEFVQQAWLMGTKFSALTEQSDPLMGNRSAVPDCLPTDIYSVPQDAGLARCVTGMPQFVTVRGAGYFFLPSLRALRYIGSIGR